MTLWEGLKYINYVCVKENSGSTLSPQEYNVILKSVNIEMFNEAYNEAQLYAVQNKIPFSDSIASHKSLREFRQKEDIVFSSGVYSLSSLSKPYVYWGSMVGIIGGQLRKVDILTDHQLDDRRTNLLAKSLDQYPSAVVNGTNILIYPKSVAGVSFTYYRMPNAPVFDYLITSDLTINPLIPGLTFNMEADYSGWTHSSGGTSGYITSLTVELEWNEERHMEFFNRVLRKVGINLKDVQIQQYAEQVLGKQL